MYTCNEASPQSEGIPVIVIQIMFSLFLHCVSYPCCGTIPLMLCVCVCVCVCMLPVHACMSVCLFYLLRMHCFHVAYKYVFLYVAGTCIYINKSSEGSYPKPRGNHPSACLLRRAYFPVQKAEPPICTCTCKCLALIENCMCTVH